MGDDKLKGGVSRLSISSKLVSIGSYHLGKTIGSGQFGKVKLAIHTLTGERVAVKLILKSKLDTNTLRMVKREMMIMKLLNHPNVIHLYEVIETEEFFAIVMEYASGGELIDFVIARSRLPEKTARHFFRQIITGVDYCHSLRVVHRDLKPENLLLDEGFHIKLIDFGLSNCYVPGQFLKTFCGSPTYTAPELIQQKQYEGPAIDMWSLGCVLFVLVAGYLPFNGNSFKELFSKIVSGSYSLPSFLSYECQDLISNLLVVDPQKRATMDMVRNHPWIGEPIPSYKSRFFYDSIDLEVASIGFDVNEVLDSLKNSSFNDAAATYYLLLSKRDKELLHPFPVVKPKPIIVQERTMKKSAHRRNRTEGEDRDPLIQQKVPTTPELILTTEDEVPRPALPKLSQTQDRKHLSPESNRLKQTNQKSLKSSHKRHRSVDDNEIIIPFSSPPNENLIQTTFEELDSSQSSLSSSPSTQSNQSNSPSNFLKSVDGTKFQPRQVRIPVNSTSVTNGDPTVILTQIKNVLLQNHITFRYVTPFCLLCLNSTIEFELEICILQNLMNMHAVRFHRLSGDAWEYSSLCHKLLKTLNLHLN